MLYEVPKGIVQSVGNLCLVPKNDAINYRNFSLNFLKTADSLNSLSLSL